jgi:hypothetical protein
MYVFSFSLTSKVLFLQDMMEQIRYICSRTVSSAIRDR